MAQNYDKNDLAWTFRGDYIIGHNGDLMDTEEDPLRSVVQEIKDIIKSEIGSWKLYNKKGASLFDFVGETNNKRTAELVKNRIVTSLSKYGLINSRDLKVIYAPVDANQLIIRVSLQVMPTAKNALSNQVGISFVYNYAENNIYVQQGR